VPLSAVPLPGRPACGRPEKYAEPARWSSRRDDLHATRSRPPGFFVPTVALSSIQIPPRAQRVRPWQSDFCGTAAASSFRRVARWAPRLRPLLDRFARPQWRAFGGPDLSAGIALELFSRWNEDRPSATSSRVRSSTSLIGVWQIYATKRLAPDQHLVEHRAEREDCARPLQALRGSRLGLKARTFRIEFESCSEDLLRLSDTVLPERCMHIVKQWFSRETYRSSEVIESLIREARLN